MVPQCLMWKIWRERNRMVLRAIVVYRETEIPICWVSFYGKSLDGSRSSSMCDFIVIDTLGLISKLLDI